jgi:hypothetical protein
MAGVRRAKSDVKVAGNDACTGGGRPPLSIGSLEKETASVWPRRDVPDERRASLTDVGPSIGRPCFWAKGNAVRGDSSVTRYWTETSRESEGWRLTFRYTPYPSTSDFRARVVQPELLTIAFHNEATRSSNRILAGFLNL